MIGCFVVNIQSKKTLRVREGSLAAWVLRGLLVLRRQRLHRLPGTGGEAMPLQGRDDRDVGDMTLRRQSLEGPAGLLAQLDQSLAPLPRPLFGTAHLVLRVLSHDYLQIVEARSHFLTLN